MDVAQITRKNYYPSSNSPSAALPTEQNPAGNGVAEIMETDMAASVGWDHIPRQAHEHSINRAVLELLPAIRHEECLSLREQGSPFSGIAVQRRQSGLVQWDLPRMLELAEPNRQNALHKVNVLDHKGQRFRDAQAGTSQQPQQRTVSQRSQLARQCARAPEQLVKLPSGKQVRRLAAEVRSQGTSGRDLRCWLKHSLVASKNPDNV
jgi:hypothetical protein